MKEPAVDTWVIVQLIASISIFGFSVGGLIIRGHRTVYDTVRAVFATLYLIWAIADASVRVIYRCIWTFKPVKLRGEENQDDTYEIRNSIQHNNTILKYAASRDYDILDFSYRKYEGGYFIVLLGWCTWYDFC